MISKLKLTQKNYVRKSITSFTPGPVPMSVTKAYSKKLCA